MKRATLKTALLGLLLSYPVCAHFAPTAAVLILLLLLILSGLGQQLRHRTITLPGSLLVVSGSVLAALLIRSPASATLVLYAPPVLIHALLFQLFFLSLQPGRQPLIQRIAEQAHGVRDDPRLTRYTRSVTRAWATLFAALTLSSFLLAVFADRSVWSLFTNGFNYLVILMMFILEYRIRLARLPHLEHPGFFRFLLSLKNVDLYSLVNDR